MEKLALETRNGLPDALRVLLDDYPREGWETHDGFGGLIRFWLDRHLMFRRLLDTMTTDVEAALESQDDPGRFAARLSRFGSLFLGELHGHHTIEDVHYFPQLVGLEPTIDRGFKLLDADHKALDGHLNGFADDANAVLSKMANDIDWRSEAETLRLGLSDFGRFLDRHLVDEEDLIVPVLLKHTPAGLV